MEIICEKNRCSGCEACVNICPENAISMKLEHGFYYPDINGSVCIDCGLCKKTCPAITPAVKYECPGTVYAVFNKNKIVRDTSSSGGVFFELGKAVIQRGGVVYGAEMDDDLTVKHVRIDAEYDIGRCKGSKYAQSVIGNVYNQVKSDLQTGRWVLFSGVPCQIGGLTNFLKKEYEKLITCEALCHGNASQQVFKSHLHYKGTEIKDPIGRIDFRYKTKERPQNIRYMTRSGKEQIIYEPLSDMYYYGFQSGILLRDSCFQCGYIGKKRCADITMGDFWGLSNEALDKPDELTYPSLVMTNTTKGEALWNAVSSQFIMVERNIEEAVKGNLSFRRPVPKHKYHDAFFSDYTGERYAEVGKKYLIQKRSWKDWIKLLLGEKVTMFLIKVLHR